MSLDISYNSYEFIKSYVNENKSCFGKSMIEKNIDRIIIIIYKNINLEDKDKEILLMRYINIFKKIEEKYRKNSKLYTLSTLFTSISSILVTAFISINNLKDSCNPSTTVLWWLAWSLSLGISLINTIGAFYKWDRKYLLMFKVYYKIEQELWMYIELVGPYSNKNTSLLQNNANEHKNKLTLFLARLELIYKRVNDNLLDIEENDQDDKDALRSCKNNNSDQLVEVTTDVNNFIKYNDNKRNTLSEDNKKKENYVKENVILDISEEDINKYK